MKYSKSPYLDITQDQSFLFYHSHRSNVYHESLFYHFPAYYLFYTIMDAIWKRLVLLLAFLFFLHLLSYRMLDA